MVKPRLTLSFICASWSIGVIAAVCFEHAFDVGVHEKDSSAEDSMGCPRKASFQGRQFRVMIDLRAAVSIYSEARLFPGVPLLKDVAPIGKTGVTGFLFSREQTGCRCSLTMGV